MVLPKDINIKPRKYPSNTLPDSFLDTDPTTHFQEWFQDAIDREVLEPDAFILSTFDGKRVNARTIALRGFEAGKDKTGIFYVYTNYQSVKAKEIEKHKENILYNWYKDKKHQDTSSNKIVTIESTMNFIKDAADFISNRINLYL